MTEARRDVAAAPAGVTGFTDSCRWLADAHLTRDPEQITAALCDLYQLLVSHGWTPPEKAAILLRLHDAAVDVALTRLVDPASD